MKGLGYTLKTFFAVILLQYLLSIPIYLLIASTMPEESLSGFDSSLATFIFEITIGVLFYRLLALDGLFFFALLLIGFRPEGFLRSSNKRARLVLSSLGSLFLGMGVLAVAVPKSLAEIIAQYPVAFYSTLISVVLGVFLYIGLLSLFTERSPD